MILNWDAYNWTSIFLLTLNRGTSPTYIELTLKWGYISRNLILTVQNPPINFGKSSFPHYRFFVYFNMVRIYYPRISRISFLNICKYEDATHRKEHACVILYQHELKSFIWHMFVSDWYLKSISLFYSDSKLAVTFV